MTAPYVPIEIDLRDFAFVPIDVVRLFQSRFHAVSSDAAWRAGVTLWLKSWHQVPAATLPNDDIELTRLAELGRDVATWRELKAEALHGWTLCDDGRLHHRTMAEKALEAWAKKLSHRRRSLKGNAKRWGVDGDPGHFDAMQQRCVEFLERLTGHSHVAHSESHSEPHKECDAESLKESFKHPKGQGQGQGQEKGQDEIVKNEVVPQQSSRARARGTRLASDWLPPEEFVAWALHEQPTWTPQHVQRVGEMFRDYWTSKPGREGLKLDWLATWRNWVRRERPLTTRPGATTTISPATAQTMEAGRRWLEQESDHVAAGS